jgi:hypothetical protein
MEVCYWALLFMPLVILHHLLNVFVQLANKRGFKQKKILSTAPSIKVFQLVQATHAQSILPQAHYLYVKTNNITLA